MKISIYSVHFDKFLRPINILCVCVFYTVRDYHRAARTCCTVMN